MDSNISMTAGSEEGGRAGVHDIAREKDEVPLRHVLTSDAQMPSPLRGATDSDGGHPAIGPLHGYDGIGALRHRRSGHDADGAPLHHTGVRHVASGDITNHPQGDGSVLARSGNIGNSDGVAVHG